MYQTLVKNWILLLQFLDSIWNINNLVSTSKFDCPCFSSESNAKCDWTADTWSCCTALQPCGYGGGDCDNDDECAGSLVCGTDNCVEFFDLIVFGDFRLTLVLSRQNSTTFLFDVFVQTISMASFFK